MTERIVLPETGQAQVGERLVVASNIWPRPPIDDDDGEELLRAQITDDTGLRVYVAEGEEVAIDGIAWTVAEIVEDPVNRRGHVVLVRDD